MQQFLTSLDSDTQSWDDARGWGILYSTVKNIKTPKRNGRHTKVFEGKGNEYKPKTFPKNVGVAGTLNSGGEGRGTLHPP